MKMEYSIVKVQDGPKAIDHLNRQRCNAADSLLTGQRRRNGLAAPAAVEVEDAVPIDDEGRSAGEGFLVALELALFHQFHNCRTVEAQHLRCLDDGDGLRQGGLLLAGESFTSDGRNIALANKGVKANDTATLPSQDLPRGYQHVLCFD